MSRTDLTDSTVRIVGTLIDTTSTYRVTGPNSYDKSGIVVPDQRSVSYSYTTQVTTNRKGSVTPFFNSPVRRPYTLPVNSYTYSKLTRGPQVKNLTYMNKSYVGDVVTKRVISGPESYSTMSLAPQPPASELQALHRKLSNSLLLKAKDQKVNLAQALAERKQTADLILGNLATLARAYSKIRKGDLVGAAHALAVPPPKSWHSNIAGYAKASKAPGKGFARNTSQRWLELQYGWKPLLGDIFGAAEAYWQKRLYQPVFQRVSTKGSRVLTSYNFVTYDSLNPYFETYNCKVTIKYVCYFSIDDAVSQTMSQLGITNPALIAWELTPWSFVVDWFIPIGNFISSLDATFGLKFSKGSITTFTESTGSQLITHLSNSSYFFRYGYTSQQVSLVSVNRSSMSSFPSTQFPDFKDPFSRTHFANAVALFSTNMRRK